MTTKPAPQGQPSTITIPVDKAGSYIATLPVASIKIGNRFRKDFGDLSSLALSIEQLGQLQPIGVDKGHNLIFGERRLMVHIALERETILARIIDVDDPLLAERDENEVRKDNTPSERAAISRAIEDREKAKAKERQGARTDLDPDIVQNFARSREQIAKASGFGNYETMRQARKVNEEAIPELVDAMDRGKIAISTAAKLVKAAPEVQRAAVANPKDAPQLAKVAQSSLPDHGEDAAIPEGEPAIPTWEIKMAKGYAQKIATTLNQLKGREHCLDQKAKAPLVRNLKNALVRLGEEDIEQGIKRHLDEILPTYAAEYDRAKAISDSYAGIFTNEEYHLLISVLHPDRCPPEMAEKFAKAFHLIKSKEDLLCKAKASDRPASLPSSLSELVSRRGRKAGTKEGAVND